VGPDDRVEPAIDGDAADVTAVDVELDGKMERSSSTSAQVPMP
jgi:hypothetical protein